MCFSTRRDVKIMNLFKSKGINSMDDLSIENVAHAFSIHVEYSDMPSRCIYEDDFAIIYLNRHQHFFNIKSDFFHELAHFIQDCGNQRAMKKSYRQYQEYRAYWFTLYASMPRHIFKPLMLKYRDVNILSTLFELPTDLVIARIKTFRREGERAANQLKIATQEQKRCSTSLQPEKVDKMTILLLKQLASQVGEDKLSHEVKRLLRRN